MATAMPGHGMSTADVREHAHQRLIEAKPLYAQVALYKKQEFLPLQWIHQKARLAMTPQNFNETATVYGLILRVNAILRKTVVMPSELLDTLDESIKVRAIVAARYRKQQKADHTPELVLANGRKHYFYCCLRLCYQKLKQYRDARLSTDT